MSDFAVTIPGDAPRLNATYKVVQLGPRCPACGRGKSRLAKHENVETWQVETAYRVRAARPSGWMPGRRVRITVDWFTSRAKDGDSGIKALADAIATGLNMDDGPFLVTIRSNEVDKANPRTVVEVSNE